MRFLLLVPFIATACVIESKNVNVGQVNRPSVPFTTGAGSSGIGAFTAGASSMPTVTTPEHTSNSSGAEVPQSQARGELVLRVNPNFFVGAVYERGIGHKPIGNLPEVSNGNVSGFGLMLGGTIRNGNGPFSVGVTATAMRWRVPYDQYTTATFSVLGIVTGVSNFTSSDADSTGTLGLGLWPSYDFGTVRLFGGGYLTQRPTVELFTTDTTVIGPVIASDEEDVVGNHAIDLVLAAGVEIPVSKELAFSGILNQEILSSIMKTGPSLQLAVTLRFGEHGADRKRTAPPPPPYNPYPYPPYPPQPPQ